MRSFGFDRQELYGNRFCEIWKEIERNRLYFRKFCGEKTDEAMQRALLHAMSHYNSDKGSLKVYLKSLAKTIVSSSNSKCVCVDFLENTVEDNLEDETTEQKVQSGMSTSDFSQDIVNDMYLEIDRKPELIDLALVSMEHFLRLCESIETRNTANIYSPQTFKDSCLALAKKCKNFNSLCLSIYDDYGDEMKEFLSDDETAKGVWCEADYTYISQRTSKRIKLVDENGDDIEDADLQPFYVKGSLKDKKIVKVRFKEQLEMILDYVDSPVTNQMKFVIENRFIIRTLGGSFSVANPKLYNIYELIEDEILTNLLRDTDNSSILNVGTECMYFLCKKSYDMKIPDKTVRDIFLRFIPEEVVM